MQRSFFCLSISLVVLLSTAFGQGAPAPGTQFRALYNFTGGEDGCCLYGGLAEHTDGCAPGSLPSRVHLTFQQ